MRTKSDNNEGLIMVDGNSGELLGINKVFSTMVNSKITGKQVVSEEIKLASIFPEVNLSLLGLSGVETTL